MVHVVYCDNSGKKGERELDKIMSHDKCMVIRGAAGRKIPHSRVFENDELYFMEKASLKITARAVVKHVDNYVKLTNEEIEEVLENNQAKLLLTDKQKQRWRKKCLCLVEFYGVESIDPLAFDHQVNMDDWLIIEKIEDVVVGTSKPFDYNNSRF